METIGARMRLEGARVRLRKEKGYLAEVAFMAKVMSLGMVACKPYGDPPACDFVVLCGAGVTRVQVKSGWKEWHGGYPVKTSNYERPYRASELDVVVVYIVPEDAWYVIPVRELRKTRMASFYPHVRKSRGKLEKWREAWGLLGRDSPSRRTRFAQNPPQRHRVTEVAQRGNKRHAARGTKKLNHRGHGGTQRKGQPKVPPLGAGMIRPHLGRDDKSGKAVVRDDTLSRRRARVAWEALGEWMFED